MNTQQIGTDRDNIEKRIKAELIRLLYGNAMVVLIGSGITAIILFILMWDSVPLWLNVSWLIAIIVLYSTRLYWILKISRDKPNDDQTPVWEQRFVLGALFSGLLWGSAGILIFIYGTPDYYRTTMLILCGLSAASMVTHAPVRRAYYSFIHPALWPIIIAPLLKWNFFDIILSILAFIFMTAMLVLANQVNSIFRRELSMRFANEELTVSLQASQEKYRIVADFTSDWEYWQAPDKTFRYISPSCKDFTGYSVQDFIDDPDLYINIVHPNDRLMFKEHLWKFNNNEIMALDFRITCCNGEIRWISHICRPLYSDTGEFLGRRISNRDITARKQIEEELKENEEKLRTITHTAQDAIILMDNEWKISFWNPAAEKIFGYTNEEAIGKKLHMLIIPEKYRDTYQKGLDAFKLTGAGPIIGTSIELEATKKNGTLVEVELSLSSIRLKGTWHAVGILRDITKRKEADNKLRDNEHSLSEAQRIAHIGNWDWNIVTNELRWSDEIYRIFGLTPQLFNATYPSFLNTVHPDDRTAVVNAVNEAVNNHKPYNLEHRIVHPDGTIRMVNEQGEVSYDESGKAIKMIGTVQDITEKKLYEQQLKEANAAKDKFFSIIAHDLKNPFNALLGFAQMLSDNLSELEQDELRDIVSRVNNNAQSAYSLIENLLQWSRAQTGRLEYNPEKIELKTFIEDSFRILAGQAENKQIKLIDKTQPFNIYADINLTKTILRNLMSNAIKYTGKGGSVSVSSKQDNNMIEVSVSDTGVGMPHEALEKLFRIDTKYSTPGTAKETGTGLGLILCKEFVEKQGGKISVESEVGKGTTFKFTLPVKQIF